MSSEDDLSNLPALFDSTAKTLHSQSTSDIINLNLLQLSSTLENQQARKELWIAECQSGRADEEKVVHGLVKVLKERKVKGNVNGNEQTDPQTLYLISLSIWQLTFDADVAKGIVEKYPIIPLLGQVVKTAVKEKVIRVIIATFRNLLAQAPETALPPLLLYQLGLLEFLDAYSTKVKTQSDDEELKEDVEWLREELKRASENMTTYDEYIAEIKSAQLAWSPMHTSDDFWRDNANKLNDKDYEGLKQLVQLLLNRKESEILAVAANDIGKYIKFVEVGKQKAQDLGAKSRLLELMSHPDSDVKYQALSTLQRFLSQAW